ncbi:MAG TPA: S8 family serine peptidase [Phycisphaerae bacterium]|nr:S8 family serine peptidase [Phycisphaerae bacterium]
MRLFHVAFAGLGRRPLAVGLSLAIVLAVLPSARADDVFYAGGKAYTLQKSTTELGVLLADDADATQIRAQATIRGAGSMTRIDGDKLTSRYRILRVSGTMPAARRTASSLPGVEWARPVYRFPGCQSPVLSTGRLVVRVAQALTEEELAGLFDDYGLAVVQPFDGLSDTYVVAPQGVPDADEVATAAALYADDRTVYVHPDFAVLHSSRQSTPQDEYFVRQWHLNNTGQDGGTPGADISVIDAWETTLGEDIRIGMLDDCCDVDHEDLQANYLRIGQDINDGDDDPRPSQKLDRHGTSVMGLMCAAANQAGVRGVAPNARFTVTRGLGFTTYSATASAFTFARQQEVDVHNNSWGYEASFPTPDIIADAIRTAFKEGRDGKGMVIVFASGNGSRETPEDISSLPTVLAVGATNANDVRASYSNWGDHLDVMGPSGFGEEATTLLPLITTTDNTDDAGYAEPGYNIGGLDEFEFPNLPNPDYTLDFGGTSAASPVVAGVAALVISANPELTASQVRVILEHTAEKVSPAQALYDGVTSRSNQYGYGRVNAAEAVQAAVQAITNGGFTWPDRVSNVTVIGNTLRWQNGAETNTILIVRSNNIFQWTPVYGPEYETGSEVAPGVILVFKQSENPRSYDFDDPEAGTAYFGIYAQNAVGRYSWGVAVDSEGHVTDAGPIDIGDDGGGDDGGILPIHDIPQVNIDVTPRDGVSPLVVTFRGNALSNTPIASAEWDFGDGSPPVSERAITHTYTVADRDAQRFIATFSVVDEEGDLGSRSIAIDVSADISGGGGGGDGGGGSTASAATQITDSFGNEISSGFAPLDVELTVQTSNLPGEFENIFWDLGDGTTASTVTVLHTYTQPGSFPVQATITTCHASGCSVNSWQTKTPVKFITVLGSGSAQPPDDGSQDSGTGDEDQNGALPQPPTLSTGRDASGALCGAGLVTVWLGMLGAPLLRRRTK